MNILTIIGTRPQMIKSMYMSNKFQDAEISEIMVNTGQHYDFNMDGAFHTKSPDYTLNIRHENPNQFLTDVQIGLERITRIKDIDGILVYGDTISTLAGALFANKHNKKLFHIEAGLRSGDSSMPEEIVRIMTKFFIVFVGKQCTRKR